MGQMEYDLAVPFQEVFHFGIVTQSWDFLLLPARR